MIKALYLYEVTKRQGYYQFIVTDIKARAILQCTKGLGYHIVRPLLWTVIDDDYAQLVRSNLAQPLYGRDDISNLQK